MASTETISVYLLKPGLTTHAAALREEASASVTTHVFSVDGARGTLFVQATSPTVPDWVRLVGTATSPPVAVVSQSTSALLILEAAGRQFALTFGYGRHLLADGVYQRRFGLRVAINAVDPEQIRASQSKTFNGFALHTQRQISRLSTIAALELDWERDLVTSLAGSLADPSLGRRIEGRDAARLTAKLSATMLVQKCSDLLVQSQQSTYKAAFPWIDTIEEITDPAELSRLERLAASELGKRAFSMFDLFPPEVLPSEVVQFKLWPSQGGLVVIEPDARLLRYALSAPTSADDAMTAMKRHKLIGLDSNGADVARWSFWECLHFEARDSGDLVILDSGLWYRIDSKFASDVDTFARGLRSSPLALPAANRGETEGQYNARAAQTKGLTLLDRQFVRLPGQSAIEPCDLFSDRKMFVHVKRRKGGSAPLSHLLGQALVSSESFVSEPEYRTQLRAFLTSSDPALARMIPEPIAASDYSIVLAMITESATGALADKLPFFTKVFLRQNVRTLRRMGFAVYLDEVPTNALPPRSTVRGRRRSNRAPAPPQSVRSRTK